jgi:hypothetical protein
MHTLLLLPSTIFGYYVFVKKAPPSRVHHIQKLQKVLEFNILFGPKYTITHTCQLLTAGIVLFAKSFIMKKQSDIVFI